MTAYGVFYLFLEAKKEAVVQGWQVNNSNNKTVCRGRRFFAVRVLVARLSDRRIHL